MELLDSLVLLNGEIISPDEFKSGNITKWLINRIPRFHSLGPDIKARIFKNEWTALKHTTGTLPLKKKREKTNFVM